MCYIVHGAINDNINTRDLEHAICNSGYRFKPATKHELKINIANKNCKYRITTRGQCDCDFPIGMHNKFAKELVELAELIYEFRDIRNVKHILISKTWISDGNKKEETIHIDDIDDLTSFFADMKEDCLYCIELYERYI